MIRNHPFTLIDVGASGGVQERWKPFSQMKFVGFEPDPRAPDVASTRGRETWLNTGVAGSKGKHIFYLTGAQCNSSLLKPNLDLISRLAYDPKDFEVRETLEVPCDELDNLCAEHSIHPDFLKLDTQGTELDILKGAQQILSWEVTALEVEVEFLPLYQNQSLFAEVDSFLRGAGFQLMDLGNQLYVKGRNTEEAHERKGQLVSCDALYFRSPESFVRDSQFQTIDKLKAFMAVAQAYGFLSYAVDVLSLLSEKNKDFESLLTAARNELPKPKGPQISERKFASIRSFFERRIKARNANWNYGIGNPRDF